jgi:hypothetical protein
VETALERWVDAEAHLTSSLSNHEDAWVRKNRALLDQALVMSRNHIGEIVFTGPAGATVTVAGRSVGTLPSIVPVRLGEGTVLVTASSPGFKQFIQSVTVQPANRIAVAIALDPLEVRTVTEASSASLQMRSQMIELRPHYSWRTWTGAGLVGAGAGVLAWGIAWIVVDGRGAGGACSASITAPCQPVYNTKTLGWILAGAGAGAAIGGGLLLYDARSSGREVTLGFGPTSVLVGGHF